MALTGAQLKSVLGSVNGVGGQVASFDQLAAGANAAMTTMKVTTVNQAAGFLATMVMESACLRTTTEYGTGQRYAPYIGRTFEQITWPDNYAAFGRYVRGLGMVTDPDIFVKNPSALGSLTWAWLGGVWFWTMNRSNWGKWSNLMQVANTGSILLISKAVNVGNPNSDVTPYGMDSRTTLFNAFKALGTSILPGTKTTTTTSTAPRSTPAGAIPGKASTVVAAANKLWNQYKGKLYTYRWPGLVTLGDRPLSEYWCADFVRLAFKLGTGYDWKNYTAGRSGPAYCPALVSGMTRDQYWSEVAYKNAQPGDVVFFFNGTLAYHTGLVEFGPSGAGHNMQTIEGNTSTPGMSSSMSAGGTLAKKTRDDRYYKMRIFRPTYWPEGSDEVAAPADDDLTTDSAVVDERPRVGADITGEDPGIWTNPIDQLNVSASFRAAVRESANRHSEASAWYDGQCVVKRLPIDLASSKVSVTRSDTVRRKASLKIPVDRWDAEAARLEDILSLPGVKIRIETGFTWSGFTETVPVFDGVIDSVGVEWPGGAISVECSDSMKRVAQAGFTVPVSIAGGSTYVEIIRWLISEVDDNAKVIDLTGNVEKFPSIFVDMGPDSRINTVMSAAAAIGAEVFKSPVAGCYVIRPIAEIGSPARWMVRAGTDLISVSRNVKWDGVKNKIAVTSERSDSARMVAEWADTDPDSLTRWGGPFGWRTGFWTTSVIPPDREQLEAAAKALCQRIIGGRVDVDWQQLLNPLLEAGDVVDIHTDTFRYRIVCDEFDIPLGHQRVSSAKARSLNLPGVS